MLRYARDRRGSLYLIRGVEIQPWGMVPGRWFGKVIVDRVVEMWYHSLH